ncbi:MAG: GNAT family N-acetyltransferase [Myxococcales bacterium]|nr:GNAT family N-acetyltransferase [Myxococcales bacterium]
MVSQVWWLVDAAGERAGRLHAVPVSAQHVGLMLRPEPEARRAPTLDATREALARMHAWAREGGRAALEARVQTEREGQRFAAFAEVADEALRGADFVEDGGRWEFSASLEDPRFRETIARFDRGPLRWQVLTLGHDDAFARAAGLLTATAAGDPGSDDDDDAVAFLAALRDAPGEALEVIVGCLDAQDRTLAVVQVAGPSATGRVVYLGVTPSCRGLKLGRQAWAHALARLGALGARHYVGGTHRDNRPMLSLFGAFGLEANQALRRYRLRTSAGALPAGRRGP